jgi:hypothetical protein
MMCGRSSAAHPQALRSLAAASTIPVTNAVALAEIKSWRDKLNENQKRWIEDNHRYLHLPFKLVQVHKLECNVSASA